MSEPLPRTQETDPRAAALAAGLDSMHGYSPFVALTDIFRVAQTQFGFDGSLEDVVSLLPKIRDVTIEPAERIEDYRVVVKPMPPNATEN